MDYCNILKDLCESHGVSGFEKQTAELMRKLIKPYCDYVEIDRLGNVSGFLSCGREDAPTVMLEAHIDQIGFLVSDVLEGGFLSFVPVGGVDSRMLPDAGVLILSQNVYKGVISCLPPHILTKEERDKPFEQDSLAIDAGLTEEQAKKLIPVGTPVVFEGGFRNLAERFVSSPALDNRAGVLALLIALERLYNAERKANIIIQGSVMEEKNLHGALTGAYRTMPDCAIAVDVTHAKTPDAPAGKTFAAGGGAMIGMGPNLQRKLTKELIRIAEEKSIPHDFEVMEGSTGTNAWAMQIVSTGIPCALLSIPLKYMHTPVETVCFSDIEAVADLICEFISGGAIC
ncbi:MAG: M42 family peptidase [Bacillota bacterium]|nr:M42 family peptidase [Bacillota bacterium]